MMERLAQQSTGDIQVRASGPRAGRLGGRGRGLRTCKAGIAFTAGAVCHNCGQSRNSCKCSEGCSRISVLMGKVLCQVIEVLKVGLKDHSHTRNEY